MYLIAIWQMSGSILQVLPCCIICYLLADCSYRIKPGALKIHLVLLMILSTGFFTVISMYFYIRKFPHCYLIQNFLFMICVCIYAIYLFNESHLPFWKKAFIFMFSFNYGLLIGLIKNSICIQMHLLKNPSIQLIYNPKILLIILVAQAVTFPPLLYLLTKIQGIIEQLPDMKIWCRLTLFDTVFCLFYFVYSLRLSMLPSADILLLFSTVITVIAQILLLYFICYILFQMNKQQQDIMLANNMKHQLQIQEIHYQKLEDSLYAGRRLNHDVHHHFNTIQTLLEEHHPEEALSYLNAIQENTYLPFPDRYCENTFLNATLSYYLTLALEDQIEIHHEICLSEEIPFECADLCILIGNCLENALDAARLVPLDEHPFIHIKGNWVENQYIFSIHNSYINPICKYGSTFLSTKHSGNGIGILNVETIAEKYKGSVSIKTDAHVFKITIILKDPSRYSMV